MYYPGEIIISSIPIKQLSFCEPVEGKNSEQLLVRGIEIYEVPQVNIRQARILNNLNKYSTIKLESEILYSYKSKDKTLSS